MSTTAAPGVAQATARPGSRQLRVAFVGEPVWLPGRTFGLHVGHALGSELASVADSLDRIASFRPSLAGERAGEPTLWCAIPAAGLATPSSLRCVGRIRVRGRLEAEQYPRLAPVQPRARDLLAGRIAFGELK
jgi:hypothetical protein